MSRLVSKGSEETPLARLRGYIAEAQFRVDSRLPPERELCGLIGMSRSQLRAALAELESEGQIWRHVGIGTFVGSRPIETSADAASVARQTNPAEVMRTRLLIEPEVAALAAINATPADITEMRVCLARTRSATTWRQYESWDERLHRVIVGATHNTLLLALVDTLSTVRRAVTWGRLRVIPLRPAADHHSFAEHDEIVDAIEDRDIERAREAMRRHLESVERKLLSQRPARNDLARQASHLTDA